MVKRTSRGRRTSRSMRPNDLYGEWDRVSFARRQAEKSGDSRAIAAARDDERRVYDLMQAERRGRVSRNPGARSLRGLSAKRLRTISGPDGRPVPRLVKRNVRLKASTELKIEEAIAIVREMKPPEQKSFLPPAAWKHIVAGGPGWYSYGSGKKRDNVIRKYKTESLGGALTSTRIAASASGETHWLVDNHGRYPVVIRIFDAAGKSAFRVEEYAKKLTPVFEYVEVRRSKRGTAKR